MITTECQCAGVWHMYTRERVDGLETDCIYRLERTLHRGWSIQVQYPRLNFADDTVAGFPTLRSAMDTVRSVTGQEDSLVG